MAFTFTNFAGLPLQHSPLATVFEDLLKGYKIGQEPARMQREAEKEALINAFQKMKNEQEPERFKNQQGLVTTQTQGLNLGNLLKKKDLTHKDVEYALTDALRRAQIERTGRPEAPSLNALEKAQAGVQRVIAQYGPDSPEAKQARDYAARISQGSKGVEISSTPEGGFNVSVGGTRGDEGNKSIAGFPSLKKGESYILDDKTRAPVGITRPTSSQDSKKIAGRLFFNEIYPIVNEGLSNYSGPSAELRFGNDLYNYDKDEEAKRRIDNYLLGKKLLTATGVKENATIGGSQTLGAFRELKKSLDSSTLNKNFEKLATKFGVVNKANKLAGDALQRILNSAEETSQSGVPAQQIQYFNPKESLQPKSKGASRNYSDKDLEDTARKYGITKEEVRKRLDEHHGAK